jgi:hypothetical protein
MNKQRPYYLWCGLRCLFEMRVPVSFNNIDQVIDCVVSSAHYISVVYLVLTQDSLHCIEIQVCGCVWSNVREVDSWIIQYQSITSSLLLMLWTDIVITIHDLPPLSFFLNVMCGGCLFNRMPKPSSSRCNSVVTHNRNTKNTKFITHECRPHLNNSLVNEWLHSIKDDTDQVACTTHSNNLTTSTFTIFGTFNDTRQVKKLNFSTLEATLGIHALQVRVLVIGIPYSGSRQECKLE